MPEIDQDLFRLLLVALMGIAVLLLLALISALSGIRKALKEQVQETRSLAESGALAAGASGEPPLLPSEPVEDRPPSLQTPEPSHYGIDDSDDRPLVGDVATPGAAHIASPASEPDVSPAPVSFATEASTGEPESPGAAAPWDQPDEDEGRAEEPAASATGPETTAAPSADPFAETAQPADPFAETPQPADPFAETAQPAETPPAAEAEQPARAAADSPASEPVGTEAPGSQDVLAGTPGASSSDPFLTGDDENPFMRDADQPAPQSTLDEPEEQPFERNGRWYFKREGELLVYEEGTGEWVPAESTEPEPPKSPPVWSPPAAGEPEGTSAGSFGGAPTDTAELDAVEAAGEEPRPAAGGGFWKCPSCAAVNGSSATTCRMCFSARP